MYRISVIIPTYNRAKLLCETLETVFNQTYKNYEVIVIDDGSTDKTSEAVKPFTIKPNFRYYFQENKGRSVARNHGMEMALGEYLWFLDSDDFLLPDALETLVEIAQKYPDSGVVGGRNKWADENGIPFPIQGESRLNREVFSERLYIEKIRKIFLPPSNYMIKKEIAKSLGGFKTRFEPAEDADFFLSYCDAVPVSITQKVVVHLRRHGDNTPYLLGMETLRNVLKEKFNELGNKANHLPPQLIKDLKSEYQIRLAEDYYILNDNLNTLRHYLTAIKIKPKLILDLIILKRTAMTLIPWKLREKVRNVLNRNKDFV